MNKTTTLNQLAEFYKNEKSLLAGVGLSTKSDGRSSMSPKKSTVDFLIRYSQALSVRNSSTIGLIEHVLN